MYSIETRITEKERGLIECARRFRLEYVVPNAETWDRDRRMAIDAIEAAAGVGLTAIEVPEVEGGQGAGFCAKVLIAEELSRSDMGFAFSLLNTQNVAARLAATGTRSQIDRFVGDLVAARRFAATALTEPGAGSDFASIRTRAVKVAGGWRLDGEKAWITNAAIADLFVVYAQTDAEKRWRGIASFLVDARQDGFERSETYDLFGGHTIGAGGFRLNNFFVPDEDLIAGPGEAFKSAMAGINGARTYVAAMCCGMVAESLRIALRFGAERKTFGKTLINHQGWRWKMVDVATDLEAARLLTYRAAEAVQDGSDAIMAAAHAKKFAAEIAVSRIADCVQAMGAEGLRSIHPMARHLACAKIAGYTDGSTEIQNERIGAGLLETYT